MEEFDEIFTNATAAIAEQYFHLPIVDADEIYRERVYCYELYHQMRLRWPDECPYFLNGEVDKQQHPQFVEGKQFPKPDLLIHVPGTHDNFAAIEVKAGSPAAADIRKDARTLALFRDLGYVRTVYLVYGGGYEETRDRIVDILETADIPIVFELWVHTYIGGAAELVPTT